MLLADWLTPPLLPVLRGISPTEAIAVGEVLVAAGLRVLEVTLNSPEPLASIQLLSEHFGADALVGAGTVLHAAEVAQVQDAGGQFIVAPNFNAEVVHATKQAGLLSIPGVFTPTEAFHALAAGADALKLFPGDALSPKVCKALRAVLPSNTTLIVTGGVNAENLSQFLAVTDAVGIGAALYAPGRSPAQVAAAAQTFLQALPPTAPNA
jgi:2-dehydro-3-deoxyphosphogalactonate aldolase